MQGRFSTQRGSKITNRLDKGFVVGETDPGGTGTVSLGWPAGGVRSMVSSLS